MTDFLIETGFSPEYGARELERTFERFITKPLAEEILKGGVVGSSTTVAILLVDGKIVFRHFIA